MGKPVTYFEIAGKDGEKLKQFYGFVFNWKIEQTPIGNFEIDPESDTGITGHIFQLPDHIHFTKQVTFYVRVDDIQMYLDKAERLGGLTLIPPQQIPGNRGSFAWFSDPSGNVLGLYRRPDPN